MKYRLYENCDHPRVDTGAHAVTTEKFNTIVDEHFPIVVDMMAGGTPVLDMREWLMDHVGFSIQNTWCDPDTFVVYATSVDTDAKWCYHRNRVFRFKRAEDAVIFKLTHGGAQ